MSDAAPVLPDDEASRALEALLLVSDEPVTAQLLGQLLELGEARVEGLLTSLSFEYAQQRRGFELTSVAGGWRFQTASDLSPYVERFVLEGQSNKLSAAALETLAIVAYKQPLSRAQVSSIRGVNVDGVMRTLQQRGYIEPVARDEGPGQATLYGTTRTFLEKLGINSVDDLPPLGQFSPDSGVVEALEASLRPTDSLIRDDRDERDDLKATDPLVLPAAAAAVVIADLIADDDPAPDAEDDLAAESVDDPFAEGAFSDVADPSAADPPPADPPPALDDPDSGSWLDG